MYTRDLNDAEYHCLLSESGNRKWGEWYDALAMDGYTVLWSWRDRRSAGVNQYSAILVLDE